MLKKTITYKDWNGTTRTEDFYFNLTKTECLEFEFNSSMGSSVSSAIQTIIDNRDMRVIIETIKEMLLKSYGVKSEDGRRFIKNDEIREAFEQNPAFDIIYMDIASDPDKAAEFFAGIMPSEVTSSLGPNPKAALLDQMKTYSETNNLN